MRHIELKTADLEIGSHAEVVEVSEASGHSLDDPEDAVDGFHNRIGEAGFHKGNHTLPVRFDGARESAEGCETAAVGPSTPVAQAFLPA